MTTEPFGPVDAADPPLPPLPDDLAALERALAARTRPALPPALRARVLGSVTRELATRGGQWGAGWWRYAAVLALAALGGLNLARQAAAVTDFGLAPGPDPRAIHRLERDLRLALPDLDAHEIRRQALLLHAAGRLRPAPDLRHATPFVPSESAID